MGFSLRRPLLVLALLLGCKAPAVEVPAVEVAPTQRAATVDLGHASLRVVHYGDRGPVVVLVPSLARGAKDFDDLGRRLAAAGFHAVAVNPRGIDGSTGETTGLTLHDLGADVIGVVRAISDEPAHLVGHALGNRVVRAAAVGQPDAVRTVTLLAAGGLVPIPDDVLPHLLRSVDLSLPEDERMQSVKIAFFAEDNDPAVWRDGWWPDVAEGQARAAMTPTEEWWEPPVGAALIVQCLQDTVAVEENGRLLAEKLGEKARLVELDGCGHAMLPEVPDTLASTLLAFLPR